VNYQNTLRNSCTLFTFWTMWPFCSVLGLHLCCLCVIWDVGPNRLWVATETKKCLCAVVTEETLCGPYNMDNPVVFRALERSPYCKTFKINLLDRFEGHLQTMEERERQGEKKINWAIKVVLFYLFIVYLVIRGQDSSASMATSYRLDDRRIGVRFLAGVADSYLLQSTHTDFGVHPSLV
jgi:hypothetical protein